MAERTITKENFASEVLASDKPVLIDLWAEWCGPCRMMAPVVAELAEDYAGRVRVGKVNVDEQADIAVRYGVSSIPTLLLFKDGREAGRLVGYRPKADVAAALEQLLRAMKILNQNGSLSERKAGRFARGRGCNFSGF